jgi:hypothetical protein
MSRNAALSALMLATALSSGCYEMDVPLGPAATAIIDPRLVGRWRCVTPEKNMDAAMTLTVSRHDEHQYAVSLASPGEDTLRYRGHGTDVGGTTVVNLQELKPGRDPAASRFNFARSTFLKPNILEVEVLNDDPFKNVPNTAEAARKVIEASLKTPGLFEHYCVCSRIEVEGQ